MEVIPRLSRRQQRCFVGWFGVPEPECPPNHYRLLHLTPFDQDTHRIADAVSRCRALVAVKAAESGRHEDALSAHHYLARVESTLLDHASKAAYDAELFAEIGHCYSTAPTDRVLAVDQGAPHALQPWTPPPPPVPYALPPSPPPAATVPSPAPRWTVATIGATFVSLLSVVLSGWIVLRTQLQVDTPRPQPVPLVAERDPATEFVPARSDVPLPRAAQSAERRRETPLDEREPAALSTSRQSQPVRRAVEKARPPAVEPPDTLSDDSLLASGDPASSVAADPFEGLPEGVALPATPRESGRLIDVRLAKLGSRPAGLLLRIDQEAASLAAEDRVAVRPDPDTPDSWTLVSSRSTAGDPLARVWLGDDTHLRFGWLTGADDQDAVARQLSNTALILQSGEHTRWLPLRVPVETEYASPQLVGKKVSTRLPVLANLPASDRLRLEVSEVAGLRGPDGERYRSDRLSIDPFQPDYQPNASGHTFLGESRVVLGRAKEASLRVQLLHHPEAGISLQMRPSLHGRASGGGRSTLASGELSRKRLAQKKRCNGHIDSFCDSVRLILRLQREARQHRLREDYLLSRRDTRASGHRLKAMTLSEAARTHQKSAMGATKNLGKAYTLMHRYLSAGTLAEDFQRSGGIKYRVYAQAGAGEIDLIRAVTPCPMADAGGGGVGTARVVGSWLCVDPPTVCTLLSNGQSVVEELLTQRKSPGGWRHEEDRVTLTGPQPTGTFELRDGIRMQNRDHVLYRYFER